MEKYINKAAVLIEALPYIQRFRGKKVVIKYGGSVISEEVYCESVLRDVVFMRTVGMEPIIVHGGGKNISARIKSAGIETKFIHGLRYTDKASMDIVKDVLINDVSKHISDVLLRFGATPKIMNGADTSLIHCEKKKSHLGREIDLGYVGDIQGIDTEQIEKACKDGLIPVIAPVGTDQLGNYYNINADILAGELSAFLKAQKMVYLSDIPGLLKDLNDPHSLISSVTKEQVDILIDNETISGGMIPKIQACLHSLAGGCNKIHIIDGRLQHSLLLEIFTDRGVGTEITH